MRRRGVELHMRGREPYLLVAEHQMGPPTSCPGADPLTAHVVAPGGRSGGGASLDDNVDDKERR